MRRRRRRTNGISLGTITTLILLGLVVGGGVYLYPRLAGNVQLRVDPQRVSVAIDESLRSLRGETAAPKNAAPDATPATAPPFGDAVRETTSAPSATPAPVRSLTLTAAGSIRIDAKIQKTCTGAEGYAFGPLLEPLASKLTSGLALATLENLTVQNEKLTDVNMPADALTALRQSGFDALCLGFPGALSSGIDGLGETLNAATKSGLTPYGVYASPESRLHVATLQVSDTTVALLSYQNELSGASKKNASQEEQAYAVAPLTLPEITAGITVARAAGAQIVIVSLCWGKTGATEPTAAQRELAQGIAEAGADIILGTHSGALQTVELLTAARAGGGTRQTLCAYSLGNLLTSDRSVRESLSGALLHVGMTYDLAADSLSFDTLTYTPTYVWRGKIGGKTAYRVVVSNAALPEGMDGDQQNAMRRSLKLVRDRLAGSPVTEAP